MFTPDSGCTSHMVNSLNNMTKIRELKTLVNTGKKKTMTGQLQEDWKGYHKRDSKVYPQKCTYTAYISDLSVNIFSVTCALTKGLNVTLERKSLVLNKNLTILKFEEHLYHGNGDIYILEARLYAIPNDYRKTHSERNNP